MSELTAKKVLRSNRLKTVRGHLDGIILDVGIRSRTAWM